MSLVFVASQSSCFFLCSREQIRQVENQLKSVFMKLTIIHQAKIVVKKFSLFNPLSYDLDILSVLSLEWVEFTPYEFGTAKYGVFGKIGDFGGKYYKGRLVKSYHESPLHYLQGQLNVLFP